MSIVKFRQELDRSKVSYETVPDVQFSLKEKRRRKHTGQRDLLLISTYGLSYESRQILAENLKVVREQYISFPIKERSKHLMIRFRHQIYNYGYWPVPWVPRFRIWPSGIPSKAAIETMVPISEKQADKMSTYIDNIKRNRRRVIGGFQNEGTQRTQNNINNNLPLSGGHNCTSWVATAPLSEAKKSFMEELGADRDLNIGTNPGWWSSWLLSKAHGNIFAIYWDDQPLKDMKKRIDKDGYFVWDFKRM